MKSFLTLAVCCLLFLISCSGSPQTSQPTQPNGASLTTILVSPSATSVSASATQHFTAVGQFSDGTTKDLTSSVTWSSANGAVASIDASGLATGVAAGITTITATSSTVHGTANLTVNNAIANLSGLVITPQISSMAVSTTQQFTATGTYSDGSSRDLSSLVTWSSSATVTATVNVSGLVTALAAGTTTITATLGGVTQSITVTVSTPTISDIFVSPDGLTEPIGVSQQYVATADYSDGSSSDLSSGITWSSSTPAVATVDSFGVVTTVGPGTTSISATVGTLSDSSTLTVVPAQLQSITVTPGTAQLAAGTQLQFTATGNFDDGSTQLLTSLTWSCSAQNLASIDANTGIATGVSIGTATVTATSGAISGTASLTITNATISSIAVTPANSTMPIGAVKQFTALATLSDNSTQNVTLSVLWSSSNAAAASITNQGLATSVANGTTTISATMGAVNGSTSLTVTTATLVSMIVNPANAHIAVHTYIRYSATGNYSDGSTVNNLLGVSWKSTKPQFASIRGTGIARGKRVGTVTIKASLAGLSGSATLVVGSGTLVSTAITPLNPSISVGGTQQFTVTGTFSDSTTQDLTLNSHWSSTSALVATIANNPSVAGLASSLASGVTTIGVNTGGMQTSTSLTVN
ncbi:MAG: Ig-like domain-containing protein [Acidobacteriota bacterium]|nr:Ig-like domain-containing protein [Acidobacteriota bacterium]